MRSALTTNRIVRYRVRSEGALRQSILTFVIAAIAAVVLTPLFFVSKLLFDAGLEFVFGGVVGFGLLPIYVLRRETTG